MEPFNIHIFLTQNSDNNLILMSLCTNKIDKDLAQPDLSLSSNIANTMEAGYAVPL